MKLNELHTMANTLGLANFGKHTPKKILIRRIQLQKGEEPCFLSDKRISCDLECWCKNDCKKLTAAWMR